MWNSRRAYRGKLTEMSDHAERIEIKEFSLKEN